MNLIDFHVTKIITETKDKVYKLYNMSEAKLKKEKSDEWYYEFLHGDGIEQEYEYWDDGGYRTTSRVFNLSKGQTPYYVGYVGQH